MQALIVTIGLATPVEDLLSIMASYDRSLEECDGHVTHYWLYDQQEIGLFHVFEDEDTAERYVESRLLASLTAHAGCSGQSYIRWFDVVMDGKIDQHKRQRPTQVPERRTAIAAV